ncbi:hypothetical protein MUK42_36528 [Musa troglodytarum]|uniref:Uncharacterized protein n=1 Tax=Musa troglodytarum TaxID=320322 RepID=A0A9E7JCP5_9LILI|nr:hypothetical protein MUK42_36528 [Musa troglodytarum]
MAVLPKGMALFMAFVAILIRFLAFFFSVHPFPSTPFPIRNYSSSSGRFGELLEKDCIMTCLLRMWQRELN